MKRKKKVSIRKKKVSISKKHQFFKNGLPVTKEEFYGITRGANIIKNPATGFDNCIQKG